jgi:hypothetical protein
MTKPLSAEEMAVRLRNDISNAQFDLSSDRMVHLISQALTLAQAQGREEGKKEAHRTMQGLQTVLQRSTDLTDGYDDGYAAGFAEAIERAAKVANSDTLHGFHVAKMIRAITLSVVKNG